MRAGLAQRTLVPERLDLLPPDDPEARASRRDLRRINMLMAQGRIASTLIARHALAVPRRITDLGCGDGAGILRTLRRLGTAPPDGRLRLLDAAPVVAPGTRRDLGALGWEVEIVTRDIFDWIGDGGAPEDLIVTNLFLHHFEGPPLRRLMEGIAARASLFIATEPVRTGPSLAASRLVGLIGANAVTRHDAAASVRAGFRTGELGALWPGEVLFEGRRGAFTQAFAARS